MSTEASSTASTLDEELPPADGNVVNAADGEVSCPASIYPQQNVCTSMDTSQANQDESVAVNGSNPPLMPLNILELQSPGNESAPSKGVDNATDSGAVPCTMNESGPQRVPQQQEHEAEGEGPEYFCGIGPCHPPWLQWLRDARVLTFLLCLYSIVEGALVTGMYIFRA